MPITRFDDQAESVATGYTARESVATGYTAKDVTREVTNIALAEHIGRFVAGEVSHKFISENLADRLKGRNAIHVSVSWG